MISAKFGWNQSIRSGDPPTRNPPPPKQKQRTKKNKKKQAKYKHTSKRKQIPPKPACYLPVNVPWYSRSEIYKCKAWRLLIYLKCIKHLGF